MAGILGNAPTASKSGGGILFKKQQEKVSVQGSKKQTLAEQKLHSLPKPPTYSGIDDIAVAKAEKFGTKQVGTNPFQTPKLDPSVNKFMGDMQLKQSGIMPTKQTTFRQPTESELKSPITQFVSGAYEGSNIARGVSALQKLSGQKEPLIAKLARDTQPHQTGWRTAGKVYSGVLENAAMYGTVGKAAEGANFLQGIKNPFLRNMAGQQLADTVIQTPGVILQGVADKKSVGEIAKDVGVQQAQDLAGNLIMSGVEAGVKAIFKKLKAGKALAQADVDTVQKATKQMGGDPTASVDDQLKKLDDYFQQKRTDPLGGKLPKAEPTPLGGTLPKGDIPGGMKERGFSRNIRTDTAMPDDIRKSFDTNPLTYDPLTNQETLAKAQTIMNQGEEAATAELYRSLSGKEFKPESVPLSKLIAQQALERGDTATARQVLSETADRLTEAGQFSQAAKILREADPETFLMTIDKQIRKLNEQGLKQYGKKWANVDLLPDEITAIQSIPRGSQQAYEEVWEQIGSRIAKDLPSTGMEKFDAWRRMAMLLNPKTHIRNVGGNVVMVGMRKSSDTLAAALEKAFVPTGQRTKSFGWSLNKDLVSKVDDTWNIVKKDILGESRWEIDNLKSLGMEKKIFNKGLPTKAVEAITGHKFDRGALQWVNELSLKTLNAEDNIFTQRAFKDALGQFMQANKLDVATDTAIAYAKRRALEATFKQANELASTLNRWKRIPVVGKFVEGAVPFTKTPANIVMRGIEYSPGGLIKALYDAKAGKTAATVIEDLSKGLTGSAITALGFWLGSMGWAKVDRHRSQKAEALYSEMGDQTYAINTPLGSYTFDWAQPFAIPLAMGIAAQEAIRSRKDGSSLIMAIKDGIAAGGDTVFNMTMLRNIREIIGSYGSPTEKIMGIPVDYLEQAIFSALGQTARTVDPVKRSTYDPDPTKQWWNTIKARIPGLSKTLEPSLGIWGQEQQQGNWIQQFINPGYAKKKSDDPVTIEVTRLYSASKDTDMLPKVAPKSFSADKIEFRLTPKQLTEFQRRMGQENHTEIGKLINSPEYRSMTDEQKIKKIKKIVNDNYDDIKEDIVKSSKGLK